MSISAVQHAQKKKKNNNIAKRILPETATGYHEFLQKVTDITPSLITVYNIRTGKYIFVNKALTQFLGYEPELWMKRGIEYVSTLVHPEDAPRIMAENAKALERENKKKQKSKSVVVHFEYRVKHKNGKWKWLHTYGTVFDRDEKGDVLHVLNVSLDITRRREAEKATKKAEERLKKLNAALEAKIATRTEALMESEERLQEAQRITKMGNWEYDLTTGKIFWSDEIFRIHGRNPKDGEPDYKTFISYFPDRALIEKRVQLAIHRGVPYNIDTPIILPDKSIRYIQAIGRPIKNGSGKVVKLYGTAVDITERKLAELRRTYLVEAGRRLASSLDYETTFHNIVRSAVPAIADWVVLDLKRNRIFDRVLVVHSDKKKAKYAKILKEQYPPDPTAPGGVGKVLRTGKVEFHTTLTPEIALQTARNNPELLKLLQKLGLESYMVIPLITRNEIKGTITFVSASPARRYNKDDVIMATQLSWRIAVAIDNAMLYREAQNAVKIREEFISIASHELKTPVTSMKMYTQILERMIEKKKMTGLIPYTEKINDQIDKQTKLITDLLDISKLQLGKLEFKKERFPIAPLIKEVVESMQLLYPTHAITISGNVTKSIIGDRDRISQVIINLLTNAVKYSPNADKILIKLSQSGDKITVAITDFGIGIAKENQRKIFGRFYQVQEPLEKTYPGLGIGLYISSEILKRHGGGIRVKSEKGKGSTFSFFLPVA